MCIILDANLFSEYCSDRCKIRPVREWVEGRKGKIVYSPTTKIKKEWYDYGPMKKKMIAYWRGGMLDQVDRMKVCDLTKELEKSGILVSDDPHIVALAKVSGATLLVTEDTKLIKDFKSQIRKGKIFKPGTPASTIQRHRCPSK